ncbi:MAG: PEP-CTERM sorting domain-containing protein [Candidatus Binatia bacterium]
MFGRENLLKSLGSVAVTIALGLFSATAAKALTIDFESGDAISSGTVVVNSANVSGSGIAVDLLRIIGSSSIDGLYDTVGPVNLPSDPESGDSAELSFNTDPNNNFIQVFGAIPSLGINSNVVLLQGTISSFSIIPNFQAIAVFASGSDTKNPELLRVLGVDPETPFEFFGFTLALENVQQPGTFTAISTDIANTATPEPGSVLLLGSGLVGLAFVVRRKKVAPLS